MLQSLRPASALDRIDRLHGGDEFRAALVEVVAAFVHRFAGELHHTGGLWRLQPVGLPLPAVVLDSGLNDGLGASSAVAVMQHIAFRVSRETHERLARLLLTGGGGKSHGSHQCRHHRQ